MREKLVYVATSVYANDRVWPFDPMKTIDLAVRCGFNGVQLFPDRSYTKEVIEELKELITRRELGLLIHLPNNPIKDDLKKALSLGEGIPRCRALVHHDANLGLNRQSVGGNISIGVENSVIRWGRESVEKAWGMAVGMGTFFVFDPIRLYSAADDGSYPEKEVIDDYVRQVLRRLRPGDVIHFSDKTALDKPFKTSQCVVGNGIVRPILEQIHRLNNIVVLEHEDADLAANSLPVLRGQI